MNDLNFALMRLCKAHTAGSAAARANRHNVLQLMANELQALGYAFATAKGLKPKHITALLSHWREKGLTDGTIANRLAHVRWWADSIGKQGMIAPDNKAYGLLPRTKGGTNRAQGLTDVVLGKVACPHVRLSLRLMAAFGLRREEAMKLRPAVAIQRDKLVLKGSWCKGGRPRTVPIRTDAQRAVLDAVLGFAGRGSLIPARKTYAQHLKVFEHQTLQAGLGNTHALRHGYAQMRYATLTGWACPLAGGPIYTALTRAQKHTDRAARRKISQELGHARIEITNTYLGRRIQ